MTISSGHLTTTIPTRADRAGVERLICAPAYIRRSWTCRPSGRRSESLGGAVLAASLELSAATFVAGVAITNEHGELAGSTLVPAL